MKSDAQSATPAPPDRRDIQVALWLGLLFGLLFAVVTPPFQGPDEGQHFFRAFAVSQGVWKLQRAGGQKGAPLPDSLKQVINETAAGVAGHPDIKADVRRIRDAFSIPLSEDRSSFTDMMPTQFATPMTYLHEAAALRAAGIFNIGPLAMFYAARLANLAAYLILVAVALRVTPGLRWSLLILGLSPMALWLASTLTYDAPANGLSFLALAAILGLRAVSSRPLSAWQVLGLCALFALLALVKGVGLLLLPLLALLPQERFGGRRQRLWCVATVLAAAALSWSAAWLIWFRDHVPDPRMSAEPVRQFHFVAAHPLQYLRIMAASAHGFGGDWLEGFVGRLGWLDTDIGAGTRRLWWLLALVAVILDAAQWRDRLRVADRAWLAGTLVLSVGAVLGVMYLTWTPPACPAIAGVQGRYFIPTAALAPLLLMRPIAVGSRFQTGLRLTFAIGIVLVLAMTAWRLCLRYYT